jgi:hypothetical protein
LEIVKIAVEIVEIAKDADYKNNAALAAGDITNRALQIAFWIAALRFARTPHALAILGVSFVVWAIYEFLIREWLRNSPIELYIERSLFYKEKLGARNFDATILAEFLGEEDMDLSSPSDVRRYLANLYDSDPSLYEKAFKAELLELYAAVKDYQIAIEKADQALFYLDKTRIERDKLLKPSKALIQDGVKAYLTIKEGGETIDLKPIDLSSPYDIIGEVIQSDPRNIDAKKIANLMFELRSKAPFESLSRFTTDTQDDESKERIKREIEELRNKDYGYIPDIEETLKNSSLIVVTSSIRLKYDIAYSFEYERIQEDRLAKYKGKAILSDPSIPRVIDVKVTTIEIDECNLQALTKRENALIDERYPTNND